MHLLGFEMCLPLVDPEQGAEHIMSRAAHAWQTGDIHDWMDVGYFTLRDAHAAGWPL